MPTVKGVIRRRVLANWVADPEVVARLLPPPFRPHVIRGRAVVGVCLIRLESLRPARLPAAVGLSSENAARFPSGSLRFDHALVMRDAPHRWRAVAEGPR